MLDRRLSHTATTATQRPQFRDQRSSAPTLYLIPGTVVHGVQQAFPRRRSLIRYMRALGKRLVCALLLRGVTAPVYVEFIVDCTYGRWTLRALSLLRATCWRPSRCGLQL